MGARDQIPAAARVVLTAEPSLQPFTIFLARKLFCVYPHRQTPTVP